MGFELLWIVCVYALGAASVHAASWRRSRRLSGAKHYVLYTLNDGRHIEWVVRSLVIFHWLRGRQVLITVVDEGSTDETLHIVSSLARSHALYVCNLDAANDLLTGQQSSNTPSLHAEPFSDTYVELIPITLRRSEDWQKLPMVDPTR